MCLFCHNVGSLGGRGVFVQCKHVYHVLQTIMLCGLTKSSFITTQGVGMKFDIY
jgi:hypothetical protein